MTKDVITAILERRSVRKFKADPVPRATVGRLIDAARWAPSAGNVQPWQFYVVYNEQKKAEIASAAFNQSFVKEAPVVVVICTQPDMSAARYRERGRNLYAIQDAAAATQNILLAAEGYGLSSCWVGAFNEIPVMEALELPKGTIPAAIIPIGFGENEEGPPARRPVEEIVHVIE
ncbi:MAG: nitroreductase family protein [Firmicutes bacterium HGW-Firmicutes-14]|jgi:nitroreductase|nr:MAG: nitroreductase family protein [Firmicutes bacterium HGW-Firmicutes-14]